MTIQLTDYDNGENLSLQLEGRSITVSYPDGTILFVLNFLIDVGLTGPRKDEQLARIKYLLRETFRFYRIQWSKVTEDLIFDVLR